MPNVLKISEAASLALHTVVLLAVDTAKLYTTREIAELLGVSEAHLSKVMQRLVKEGIVSSIRGPKGGFSLAADPAKTSLLEVFEIIEGPLIHTDCLLSRRVCDGKNCILGTLLQDTNKAVHDYLERTMLAQLVSVYDGVKLC